MKRQRSRNRKPAGNSNNPNRAYESNGPEGTKVRGNAQTIYEKYQQLARDANSSGDRVLAENHLQHAEHYFRMIRQMQPTRPVSEFVQRDPFSSGFDDYDEELDGETTEAEAEAVATDEQPSEEGRYESRNDRDNRNGNRQDRQNNDRDNRDNNGNRNNRDRDRNFKDRDFRQNDRQNNDRQNNDRQNYDRQDRQNNNQNNGQRDNEPQYDENGNRRETRRERYERRRSQRFAEQEINMNASTPLPVAAPSPGFIASTEPLGGRPVSTPQPAQADFAFEPAAAEAPAVKTRAPRRERAAAPAEDAAHLPAFLSRPTPVAAEPVAAEEPAKPKRTRKRKEDAAEDA